MMLFVFQPLPLACLLLWIATVISFTHFKSFRRTAHLKCSDTLSLKQILEESFPQLILPGSSLIEKMTQHVNKIESSIKPPDMTSRERLEQLDGHWRTTATDFPMSPVVRVKILLPLLNIAPNATVKILDILQEVCVDTGSYDNLVRFRFEPVSTANEKLCRYVYSAVTKGLFEVSSNKSNRLEVSFYESSLRSESALAEEIFKQAMLPDKLEEELDRVMKLQGWSDVAYLSGPGELATRVMRGNAGHFYLLNKI
jgi:hypothetical protein